MLSEWVQQKYPILSGQAEPEQPIGSIKTAQYKNTFHITTGDTEEQLYSKNGE